MGGSAFIHGSPKSNCSVSLAPSPAGFPMPPLPYFCVCTKYNQEIIRSSESCTLLCRISYLSLYDTFSKIFMLVFAQLSQNFSFVRTLLFRSHVGSRLVVLSNYLDGVRHWCSCESKRRRIGPDKERVAKACETMPSNTAKWRNR